VWAVQRERDCYIASKPMLGSDYRDAAQAFESLSWREASIVIAELFLLSAVVLQLAVHVFWYGAIEYANKVSLKNSSRGRRPKKSRLDKRTDATTSPWRICPAMEQRPRDPSVTQHAVG
jgi:hypothetical protein